MDFRRPAPYILAALHSGHLLTRIDYRHTLTEYDRAVPGNVLYLFYERLFNDTTIRRICDFCGLDFLAAHYDTRINASKSGAADRIDDETRRQVYQRFADQYAFVRDYFAGDIPANWLADIERYAGQSKAPAASVIA